MRTTSAVHLMLAGLFALFYAAAGCKQANRGVAKRDAPDPGSPQVADFDAKLGIAQSRLEENAPFMLLTLINKSDHTIPIPDWWLDPQLDNVKISWNGTEVDSLSPFPPPAVHLGPALLIPSAERITLLLEFPSNSEFSVRSHHGRIAVQWIHHPSARTEFFVSEQGKVSWIDE